ARPQTFPGPGRSPGPARAISPTITRDMSALPSTETLALPQGSADLPKRVAVELLARMSAEGRASIREKAREDPVWFIDYLGFTFDPRLPGEEATIPFLLYDYQRELIRELVARIDAGRDLLVE